MSTSQERGAMNVYNPLRLLLRSDQAARAHAMQQAYRKAESQHPRENAPKAGSIRSLGLLGKEDETKKVLESSWLFYIVQYGISNRDSLKSQNIRMTSFKALQWFCIWLLAYVGGGVPNLHMTILISIYADFQWLPTQVRPHLKIPLFPLDLSRLAILADPTWAARQVSIAIIWYQSV